MPVTLINVFSVPKGTEEQLVSRYNFINVAIWESEELYWKAYENSAAPAKAKLSEMGAEMVPALYEVAFEY